MVADNMRKSGESARVSVPRQALVSLRPSRTMMRCMRKMAKIATSSVERRAVVKEKPKSLMKAAAR